MLSLRRSTRPVLASSPTLRRGWRSLAPPPCTATTTTTTTTITAVRLQTSPTTHPEVLFFDTFVMSDVDLHLLLLQEAHHKHGVWLNVPPQLPPSMPDVGPPAVPEPIYPPAQQARLAALTAAASACLENHRKRDGGAARVPELLHDPTCLAYPPTHQPPSFSTAGTHAYSRVIAGGLSFAPSQAAAAPGASTAASTHADGATTAEAAAAAHSAPVQLELVPLRSPVDASMLFHCGECGRAFRRRAAAEEHVQQRHESSTTTDAVAARVLDGPGLGEIIGYEERPIIVAVAAPPTPPPPSPSSSPPPSPSSSSPASSTTSAPAAAASGAVEAAAAAVPGARAASASVSMRLSAADPAGAYSATPRVTLPADSLIEHLLDVVWDDVALARDDIQKPTGLPATREELRLHPRQHYSSNGGRLFIPCALILEGTADLRADQSAGAAGRAAARATPEGAAPGVKRRAPAVSAPVGLPSSPASTAALVHRRLRVQRRNADGTIGADETVVVVGGSGNSGVSIAPTAQDMSIAELSRHYANPFGDSPNAALVEAAKEPINPFVNLEERAAAAAATGATGAATGDAVEADVTAAAAAAWEMKWLARPYACPLCRRQHLPECAAIMSGLQPQWMMARRDSCGGGAAGAAPSLRTAASGDVAGGRQATSGSHADPALVVDEAAWTWYAAHVPRFRLLDALEDHLESAHGVGEDDDALEGVERHLLYRVAEQRQPLVRAELRAVAQAYRRRLALSSGAAATPAPHDTDAVGAVASSLTADAGVDDALTEEDTAATLSPALSGDVADTAAPQVHVRAAANAVLVGTVRDMQDGFVGSTRVLQYVVAVGHPRLADAAGAGGAAAAAETEATEAEELIVVRCLGDLVPAAQLRQQMRLGSTVFVSGSLRMNRNVDAVSRRSHAYPFVQVVPPLGCVRVLTS
ncbi:Mitochondrial protein 81 [Novymonas esmeraldas]|uniref:Mitochondrial protein 81 n=1 Tax=Novymonas esmeraldas TaxID=1808958 RepID=A0AAW0EVN1_9TRYP